MISELIKLLGLRAPLTLQQIADRLHTTCDVVQDMLEMLVKKGVVEKIEACAASSACEKCKMKCGCETNQNASFSLSFYRLRK